jgi:glycerophosphoryl diester phosphodiesterase
VQQRLPSLLDPPVLFGHRGARAHAPENTMESFRLAVRLGATGLESDVWLTSDGVPVLDHDGTIRRGRWRSQSISEVRRADLPAHVPTLAELVDELVGSSRLHLSLDLKDPAATDAVAGVLRDAGGDCLRRTWLCHHRVEVLEDLRGRHDDLRLVDSTRLERMTEGPERRAARLASAGIDAVNLRGPDWTGGLVTLFHRFDRVAFSWDLQFEHVLRPALRMGLDGVFSDHVDLMVDVATEEIGRVDGTAAG